MWWRMCRFGRNTSLCGSSYEDSWSFAPPILSFSFKRKRENAPCTVEERKRNMPPRGGTRDGGRAGRAPVFFAGLWGMVRAGVWVVDAWMVLPSSLPLSWRLGEKLLLWGLAPRSGHFSGPVFALTQCPAPPGRPGSPARFPAGRRGGPGPPPSGGSISGPGRRRSPPGNAP